MSGAPLRTAFWALISSMSLSIALLVVSSFPERTALPPPASLASSDDAPPPPAEHPVSPVDRQSSGVPTDEQAAPPVRMAERPDESATESAPPPPMMSDGGSIPVNVASHGEESALAIGLEEALNPGSGDGEFIELPPPPESGLVELSTHLDSELDELIGQLQSNFDGLHTQFDSLQHQFLGLQGRFTDELTAVQTSHGDMRRVLADLVEASMTREQPAPSIEIEVTFLLMPLRGTSRQGALTLLSRSSQFSLSVSPQTGERIQRAVCLSDGDTLKDWLQLHARAQFQRHSTLHLEQRTATALDLAHLTQRGMMQARGAQVSERTLTLPWKEGLALRASATPAGLVDVELKADSSPVADWQVASLLPGNTLIVTTVLDEVYQPANVMSSGTPETAFSAGPTTRSAVAELIALIEPRIRAIPTATPPTKVAAPLPLLFDEPTTR